MRIETTLIRKGGSIVDMGDGTSYHFRPDTPAGTRHFAIVTNKAHIKRLLSIEGYEPADDDDDATVATAPDPEPADDDDDDIDIDAKLVDHEDKPTDPVSDLDLMTDDDLRRDFDATLGRAPHPKMTRANLIAKIAEAREMQAAGA